MALVLHSLHLSVPSHARAVERRSLGAVRHVDRSGSEVRPGQEVPEKVNPALFFGLMASRRFPDSR